jgi:hypothetical protein
MTDKVKRGISLILSAIAYLFLGLEQFDVLDLRTVWTLVTGVVGFVATFYGVEFVAPKRDDPV